MMHTSNIELDIEIEYFKSLKIITVTVKIHG